MFEHSLQDKVKRIFDLDRATFERSDDTKDIEQEVIFIDVSKAVGTIKDARQLYRVSGELSVFCDSEKLPYGYFSKKIAEADPEDTKDFFFFDFEENKARFQNICERTVKFTYFFNSQYNPSTDKITGITIEVIE